MSIAELRALRRRVDRAIEAAVAARRKRTLRPEVLASFGLRPEDLGPPRTSPVVGKALPPKYRDPANEENTWSGRGSKPRWFREALAAGISAEALEVQQDQDTDGAGGSEGARGAGRLARRLAPDPSVPQEGMAGFRPAGRIP